MSHRIRIALIALGTACLAATASAQTTWYVDGWAHPPGDGSAATPWASIQFGLSQPQVVSGDTLLVAPGTYREWLGMNKAVTVRATAGPEETRIEPPATGGPLISMVAFPGGLLEGFTIAPSPTHTSSTFLYIDAGVVRNCIFDGGGTANTGVDMFGGQLESCTVTGCTIGVRGDKTFDSGLRMFGTIVWGNTADIDDSTFTIEQTVHHCAGLDSDPKWLTKGPGNLLGNPGMWASAFGDVHLVPGSPCIDTGHPWAPPDPGGSPADIGALAFDPAYFHGPDVYCAPKPSSGGCVPTISAQGTSSATQPGPFEVIANGVVENKTGILLYAHGPNAVPFQGGTLCLSTPLRRSKPRSSGSTGAPCSGVLNFNFNRHVRLGTDPALVPGVLVLAQYWFRDPADPLGFGTGLSDAVRFGVGP